MDRMDVLERYQQGEHVEVWAELVALGAAVREPPLDQVARAVAHEMMGRVRHNILVLIERLHMLNYQFLHPEGMLISPEDRELVERINPIRQQYGPLPLVLDIWFEMVGGVNLCGTHPKLSSYDGLDDPNHPGPVSDPLVIGCWSTVWELDDYAADDELEPPWPLDIAPDMCHKAHTSGSGCTYVPIPQVAFDARLGSADAWDGMYFVPYLRTCFQWGGFPGLSFQPEEAAAAREELAFLTKDLLPI